MDIDVARRLQRSADAMAIAEVFALERRNDYTFV
jgi:hypothetical protein